MNAVVCSRGNSTGSIGSTVPEVPNGFVLQCGSRVRTRNSDRTKPLEPWNLWNDWNRGKRKARSMARYRVLIQDAIGSAESLQAGKDFGQRQCRQAASRRQGR